jgi:hypothetical protein
MRLIHRRRRCLDALQQHLLVHPQGGALLAVAVVPTVDEDEEAEEPGAREAEGRDDDEHGL